MSPSIDGVILAGGRARRMDGQPKGLLKFGKQTLLHHIITRAKPQLRSLALNVPSHQHQLYQGFHLPMFADSVTGYAGPLAGVHAAMSALNNRETPSSSYFMTLTTDAPFIPEDLVVRLDEGRRAMKGDIVCARSQNRRHPLFALWPLGLQDDLQDALSNGIRKVEDWTQRYRTVYVDFAVEPFDPFFNVNSPTELAQAEQLLESVLSS